MGLGRNIRQLRERRGLTLTDLAKRCRISKAYLSQLENEHNARPSAEFILRICAALDCSIDAILGKNEGAFVLPISLRALAQEESLDNEALAMLSRISYNGRQPTSVEGWRIVLEAIRRSTEV